MTEERKVTRRRGVIVRRIESSEEIDVDRSCRDYLRALYAAEGYSVTFRLKG